MPPPSATIPTPSDSVLVSKQSYDSTGNLFQVVDPNGTVTQIGYDAAGRRISVIENDTTSSSSSSSSSGGCSPSADTNRTTNLTYTPDSLMATLQVINASTSNQTTTYNYGSTTTESSIASSLLLRSVAYPDSVSGSDQVFLTYNRQGQRTSFTDQKGTVHQYAYDLLGRLQNDSVTTFAAGVDTFVQRIELTYEVRGMVQAIQSFDGSGNVLNDVYWVFNNLRQPIQTIQSHFGPASTSTTALVQIDYATPTSTFNSARPTSMYYPNGRQVTYNYGTSGGITDSASQIASLIDSDGSATHLADYSYLGLGTIVQQNSSQASLSNTLISPTGTNDPVTGDIYAGLDLFGRDRKRGQVH